MASPIGAAYVEVKPSFRGTQSAVRREFGKLNPLAAQAGSQSGQQFSTQFQARTSRVGQRLSSALKIGVVAAGTAIAAAGMVGLKTAAQMETAQIAFTTMLGSAEKAQAFLAKLADFAAKTPFDLPGLQKSAQSLISIGIDADRVIPIMTTLGNVTSGMGTGAEGVQRATVAIQQMNAAGRITAEDLNQLRDAGIPVFDLLTAATGRSTEEIAKMAQTGKLGRTELTQLMSALESGKGLERFDGMMEKQSASLAGLWSTLKDAFSVGLAKAIQPVIPMLKTGLQGAISGINTVLPALVAGFKGIVEAGVAFTQWAAANQGLLTGLGTVIAGLAAGIVAYTIATRVASAVTITWNAIQTLAKFATAGWAVQQRLLNVAMRANPIGLIVTALTLLVTGVVLAYNKVSWFRDGLNVVWAGIKIAVGAVVGWFQTYVAPTLAAVWTGISTAAMWLWQNVFTPVFAGIAAVVSLWWNYYVKPIFNAVMFVVRNILAPVFTWLWNSIIKPVFGFIGLLIRTWWAGAKIVFGWVAGFIRTVLAPVFNFLWTVVKIAFQAIRAIIQIWWNVAVKPILNGAVWFFKNVLGPVFTWLWRNIVTPVFNGIKAIISGVWNNGIKPIFNAVKAGIKTVADAFNVAKDAIGRAWDGIKEKAKKPIKFVLETIIQKGIIDNFNKIAEKFKVDPISFKAWPVKGFDVGGWTGPGSRLKPAGVVHADEFVVNKKSRRRIESQIPGLLDHMNRTGSVPGYAKGGKVGTLMDAADWWIGKGARASEHPRFGSVGRHSKNSLHYSGNAVDLNAGPGGQNSTEMRFFDKWMGAFKKAFPGIRVIWRAAGHFNHAHIDTSNGADIGNVAGGGGGGGGGFNLLDTLLKPFTGLKKKLSEVGSSPFAQVAKSAAKQIIGMPIDWIKKNNPVADVGEKIKDVAGRVSNAAAQGKGRAWALAKGVNWDDLNYIVSRESGWNPRAKNPRSSAAGLPQFIAANQKHYGVYPIRSKGVWAQLDAMKRYVNDRFDGFANARRYWERHNHYASGGRVAPVKYDQGGFLPPGLTTVLNATGRPEPVFTAKQFQSFGSDVRMPETLVVQDVNGQLIGTMKVVAKGEAKSVVAGAAFDAERGH
ncbi:tape measure protein [Saxibacter everestensis]|uniref:Tape measure protein n=1 Tax=Saxibacter everestensis TaxID=2909229 RepID=A0ABY8QUR5_9MICO|nr:tape measure protein [Brevibacteriaceae bacterium ZFBP1038]